MLVCRLLEHGDGAWLGEVDPVRSCWEAMGVHRFGTWWDAVVLGDELES